MGSKVPKNYISDVVTLGILLVVPDKSLDKRLELQTLEDQQLKQASNKKAELSTPHSNPSYEKPTSE